MTPDAIAKQIADAAIGQLPADRRGFIALAGPPASGKSTVSHALVAELERRGRPTGLLPMDGFHMGNTLLDRRGLRERKGAPETFDLAGFAATLTRARNKDQICVPTFDRTLDTGLAAAAELLPAQQTVVVEGNYLLLDAPGWRDLSDLWDFSAYLDVPDDVLQERLIQRWLDEGLPPDRAREKAEGNDLPNARLIRSALLEDEADLILPVG